MDYCACMNVASVKAAFQILISSGWEISWELISSISEARPGSNKEWDLGTLCECLLNCGQCLAYAFLLFGGVLAKNHLHALHPACVLLSGLGPALRPASFLPLVPSLFIAIFLQLEHPVPFSSNARHQDRQHITALLFAPPPNHLFRMEMLAEDGCSESRMNESRRKNYASFWPYSRACISLCKSWWPISFQLFRKGPWDKEVPQTWHPELQYPWTLHCLKNQ